MTARPGAPAGCQQRKAIGELLRVETVSSGGRSLKSTFSSGSFIDASFGGGFSVPNAIMPPRTAITIAIKLPARIRNMFTADTPLIELCFTLGA
jgi:hypothetical protein